MEKKWYVIQTQSGQENKVKANLERRLNSMTLKNQVFRILIPHQEVTTIKSGKKKTVSKMFFPGYIFIEMDLTDKLWYVIKNTPGVSDFISSMLKPTPLSTTEINKLLEQDQQKETIVSKTTFSKNDNVKIITGPFAGFSGVIDKIDEEKLKLIILVTIFGRSTPVEINMEGVEAI